MIPERKNMADKKKETKITMKLPKIQQANANQEEFYSVNFKNYIIKRGEPVEITEELAEAIENSVQANEVAITFAESVAVREPK